MSKVIKGVVKYAADEQKFGAFGSTLRGDEYNNVWFNSAERYADIIQRGNTVKLKVEHQGKGYKVLGAKLIDKAPRAPVGNSGAGMSSTDRSAVIQYQHSQEMGILAAELIISEGGFTFGNAKIIDKRTMIEALIDELTARFYNDIAPLRALGEAEEIEEDLADDENLEDDIDSAFEDEDDF